MRVRCAVVAAAILALMAGPASAAMYHQYTFDTPGDTLSHITNLGTWDSYGAAFSFGGASAAFITDTPGGAGYALDLPSVGIGQYDLAIMEPNDWNPYDAPFMNLTSAGTSITITAWLKFHGWDSGVYSSQGILTHMGAFDGVDRMGWSFFVWGDNGPARIGFAVNTNVASMSDTLWRYNDSGLGTFSTGAWTHVAVTWTAGGANPVFYINGTNVGGAGADLTGAVATYWPWGERIGLNWWSGNGLNGAVDDVRVYDQILTQSQIQQVMLENIPEPATCALLGTAGLAFWLRRRVRR